MLSEFLMEEKQMEKSNNILYVDDVKWPPASTIKMPRVIFWMGKEGVMEIFKKRRESSGKLPVTGCKSSVPPDRGRK
jgi:hypothetical protein